MAQNHFDLVADEYDSVFEPHIRDHYAARRVALFESLCPQKGRVLDYGCGTGLLGERLISRGFDVFGTEYSDRMFEKARSRGLKGDLLRNGRIPFEDHAFDLVYCVAVFHHLETPENVRRAIHEMVRVTKPGGSIVIWDHNPLNPFWPILMKRWPQDNGDERLVALEEILGGLRDQPIARISWWRSGWMPEFIPRMGMPLMTLAERLLESTPGIRRYSAHNVVVATRIV
jgi:SAM-dependent methyltransferase